MSVPFKEERKTLPCGCVTIKILDKFPYFRFVKYCEVHAKEHGDDVNVETAFVTNTPNYQATDADIENVANFLLNGHVLTIDKISKEIRLKPVIVALSVQKLLEKGLLGATPDNPHKFFFNP
jgi:membrane-bound ClpP family serine protease